LDRVPSRVLSLVFASIVILHMAKAHSPKFQPSLGGSVLGFGSGALLSVVLGVAIIESIAAMTGFRPQPRGLGWLLVPIGSGFAGAFVVKAARMWHHERQGRRRKAARAARAQRAKATSTIRAASHDPQFAAALRQAIAAVEAGTDAPQAEPVPWFQRIPVTLSGELTVKPTPPRVVGGAA